MKEQIEEMAKSIDEALVHNVSWNSQNGVIAFSAEGIARELFDDGYRKQEWISVEDRLPDAIDTFLVLIKMKYSWEKEWEYHVDVAAYNPFDNGYIDHWDTFNDWKEGQECHITHWMPLPEPPKMKGGAE